MRANKVDLMNSINEKADYNEDVEAGLRETVEDFKSSGSW